MPRGPKPYTAPSPPKTAADGAPPASSLLFAPADTCTLVRERYLQTPPPPPPPPPNNPANKKSGRRFRVEIIPSDFPYTFHPTQRLINRDASGNPVALSAEKRHRLGEVPVSKCGWPGCGEMLQTRVDFWFDDLAALKAHLREKHFKETSGWKKQKEDIEKMKEDDGVLYAGKCLYRNCGVPYAERYLAKHILTRHHRCIQPKKG